jgi:anti-sigma-K factor RskA
LAEDPHAVTVAWKAGKDPTVAAAGDDLGDIVWSPARQRGFMRIRGLAVNDPAVAQYQLWIFDAERNADYPVDGGVFDVAVGSEEVVVPMDPRLPVGRATLFAVTVEKPGGVVVSTRERLPLLAAVP